MTMMTNCDVFVVDDDDDDEDDDDEDDDDDDDPWLIAIDQYFQG